MIKELQKQIAEQKETLKKSAIEKLSPLLQGYNINVDVDDSVESISFLAEFVENQDISKESKTVLNVLFNRKENQRLFSTMGVNSIRTQENLITGMTVFPITMSYEFIATIFQILQSFINENNPIEQETE